MKILGTNLNSILAYETVETLCLTSGEPFLPLEAP